MSKEYVVTPDAFADALEKMFQEYTEESSTRFKEDCKNAAKQCAKDIQQNAKASFKGSKYAKGWTYRKIYEDRDYINFSVYNATDWQLAHLLEYGHRKYIFGYDTGEYVQGRAHIRPAEEKMEEEFIQRIKTSFGLG